MAVSIQTTVPAVYCVYGCCGSQKPSYSHFLPVIIKDSVPQTQSNNNILNCRSFWSASAFLNIPTAWRLPMRKKSTRHYFHKGERIREFIAVFYSHSIKPTSCNMLILQGFSLFLFNLYHDMYHRIRLLFLFPNPIILLFLYFFQQKKGPAILHK